MIRTYDGSSSLLVHYSVVLRDQTRVPQLLRQLDISLTTLRSHNPTTQVVVFCHGTPGPELASLCARHRVHLIEQPDYSERLRSIVGPLGAALVDYLPLQKFLNFAELATFEAEHVLYLDCDTVIFGELEHLISAYRCATVVAREEVSSARCPHGADRSYLDEDALASIARAHGGVTPGPAFNTGVVLFNQFPWHLGNTVERRLVLWALRFGLWMAQNPPDPTQHEFGDVLNIDLLRSALAQDSSHRLARLAVPYPCVNRWIVEEVALWMTLGQTPGITFASFDAESVSQASEPLAGRLPTTLWHYFSGNQEGMEARIGLSTGMPPIDSSYPNLPNNTAARRAS